VGGQHVSIFFGSWHRYDEFLTEELTAGTEPGIADKIT
jgi:hypothetical protein